nr:alpha/beta hydrolase [Hasllibacter sp. MH4015]
MRLAILNLGCRMIGKPRLRTVKTPGAQRGDFEWVGWFCGGRGRGLREAEMPGNPPVSIIEPEHSAEGTILYFHGGGFIAGSAMSHRALTRQLARDSGCRIVVPEYRLGPDAPLPAAQDDARAAWEALIGGGTKAEHILLAGDSAGGGMALSLMAELGQAGQRPAGCIAFSPWTDLTGSGASMVENARRDPLLPAERLPDLLFFAAGDADLSDARVSPLFAAFTDPAPTLIQYSETEIVRDDATRMAKVLRDAGGEVEMQCWPNTPHAWQVFGNVLPEARDALARAGDFARRCLAVARTD